MHFQLKEAQLQSDKDLNDQHPALARVNARVGGVGESQIIAAWICLQYLMHVCLLERTLDHTESTNHISKSAKNSFSSSDDLIQNDLIKIGTMTSRLHARQVAPLKDR